MFSSAATLNVAENAQGAVYTVAAADPEGAALTYAVAAGADATRFSFNATTRELSFVATPDFESPADANADNVYEIRFSASDGVTFATLDLRVTVTDQADSLRVRRIKNGLVEPVFVHGIPVNNSGPIPELVYGERRGMIRAMNPETGAVSGSDFLDLTAEVSTTNGQGLLAMAFSPNFVTDHTFFVIMSNTSGNTEIQKYLTYSSVFDRADPLTAHTILTITNHPALCGTTRRGGFMAFDKNNFLLIGHGDCGSPTDAQGLGFKGALLRIDPFRDDYLADPFKNYGIPSTNPFASVGGEPEMFGRGLRDPYRGSVDSLTGDIYIGDIGEDALEEINRRPASLTGLINFGWNLRQGTQAYNNGANSANFTAPVAQYAHGAGQREGSAVIGGLVIRQSTLTGLRPQPPSLIGLYIFGDRVSRNIWTVPVSALTSGGTVPSSQFNVRTAEFTPDAGTIDRIEAFGTDLFGTVYIVDGDGEIFRIEPAN
ncbi:MAG TPA: PQQ-dependent sugar dehydrogenase [Hyphomonadaceae bacterium]|nr:PQQ-dependent sugar dehydrogenase [Hyphomonadaceae bacterium]